MPHDGEARGALLPAGAGPRTTGGKYLDTSGRHPHARGVWLRTAVLSGSLAVAAILCTSCASLLLRSWESNFRAPNHMFLHAHPKVGDYAVYETSPTLRRFRWEIIAHDPRAGFYEICSSTDRATLSPGTVAPYYVYRVRTSGQVLEAFVHEQSCSHPERRRLRIARPGDFNYMGAIRRVRKPKIISEMVRTKAGSFLVQEFAVYRTRHTMLSQTFDFTVVNLWHPQANFGFVRMRFLDSNRDAPFLDVLEGVASITGMVTLPASPNSSVRLVLGLIRATAQNEGGIMQTDLIEQNHSR